MTARDLPRRLAALVPFFVEGPEEFASDFEEQQGMLESGDYEIDWTHVTIARCYAA